jgi:hypothetical protein
LGYKKLEQRITYALFPAPSFTVFPLKQLKIQNSKYSFPAVPYGYGQASYKIQNIAVAT